MIRIRRLSVQFGTQPVLESLSLDLKPGKVMALVGESGSGKSMTALAIMG
ncbi:MAG: ATP-binding cassette domain-containing protein, partial [Sphingobacteriia bacterium]